MATYLIYMVIFRVLEFTGLVIMLRRFRGTPTGTLGAIGFGLLFVAGILQRVPLTMDSPELLETLPRLIPLLVVARLVAWILVLIAIARAPVSGHGQSMVGARSALP